MDLTQYINLSFALCNCHTKSHIAANVSQFVLVYFEMFEMYLMLKETK